MRRSWATPCAYSTFTPAPTLLFIPSNIEIVSFTSKAKHHGPRRSRLLSPKGPITAIDLSLAASRGSAFFSFFKRTKVFSADSRAAMRWAGSLRTF